LESYIAAVYETSASVNLYSVLLGKKNVYIDRSSDYREEIGKLRDYFISHITSIDSALFTGASHW
jgi:hypothetical protein